MERRKGINGQTVVTKQLDLEIKLVDRRYTTKSVFCRISTLAL